MSRSAIASLALVVLITVFALPILTATAADETVADDFSSGDFTGSTGSLAWTIPWTESGEADGSGAGSIQVRAEPHCETDPCLNLGRDAGPDATVEREANLAGYIAGTLEFDYKVHPHPPGAGTAALEISPNGGTDWYPLDSWTLDTDTGMQHASYDITTRLAGNTRIRFSVANNTDESHLNIDNLVITVTPPNQAPAFDQDLVDRTDAEGALITINSPATDPDGGDTLTYSATGLPDGILIDPANGTISGVLSPVSSGTHAVTITVTDDGTPNLDDTDTFTWTVPQGDVFYLIAGSGGGNGGDDLLTAADPSDADPASNEMTIGTGTGTFAIDAAAVSPVSGKLFAVDGGQLGSVDTTTGVFTPLPSPAGTGDGPAGLLAFDNLDGLAFDPFTGDLYATQQRPIWDEDLLLQLDPATGAHVAGAFSGDDYVVVQQTGVYWHAADIAFDPTDGQLYMVHWTLGGQWSIATLDPATGAVVTVGAAPANLQGLAINDAGGMYATTAGAAPETFYELNKADGTQISAHTIDNGGNYGAIAISNTLLSNQAPSFDQDLGDRTDAEAVTVSFSAAATDPDVGDNLTYGATGLPPGIGIDPGSGLISGTIDYSAAAGSPYAVTVTVSDDGSPSLSAPPDTFTWTITDVNRPPSLTDPGPQTTPELVAFNLGLTATDPDGDTPSFSDGSTLPAWATLTDNLDGTATISGTPGIGDSGTSTVTITVSDGGSPDLTDWVTFDITVTNVNQPPSVVDPGDQVGAEGVPFSVNVVGSDPDGTTVAFTDSGTLPAWATLIDNGDDTATISGTPGYADAATTSVTVTATDGLLSADTTFDITISETNRPPVVNPIADQTVGEASPMPPVTVSASDPDGTIPVLSAAGLPAWASFIDNGDGTGTVSGTPGYGDAAITTVTITASDGILSGTADFALIVSDNNRSPIVDAIPAMSVAELSTLTFTAVATDPDDTAVVYSLHEAPDGATIDPVSGDFAWTPSEAQGPGTFEFKVVATDSGSPPLHVKTPVTVTVDEVNSPPALAPLDDVHSNEGDAVNLTIEAEDGDLPANGLTFTAIGLPAGLAIDPATGTIAGVIDGDEAGEHTVSIIVTDDGEPRFAAGGTFLWMVGDTNRPPTLDPIPERTVAELTTLEFTARASDPDGDDVTFSLSGSPSGARINPSTGVFTWTPTELDGPRRHSFTVVATDDGSPRLSSANLITVSVDEVNQPPTLAPLAGREDSEGDSVTIDVFAADADLPANRLTFSAFGLPPGVDIDSATGSISGLVGEPRRTTTDYRVTIRVEDGGIPELHAETSFTWTVRAQPDPPLNEPPVVNGIADQYVKAGHEFGLPVVAIDEDPLAYTATGLPPGIAIDPSTGVISGVTGSESIGAHVVVIGVKDSGEPARQTFIDFVLTVIDPNAAADKESALVALDDPGGDASDASTEPAAQPVRRGLVVMSSAAAATSESMRLPLALLLAVMVGFATVGRIGLYPLLWRGDRHSGNVAFYDTELQFGLIEPDEGGEQVFVHAHAFPRRQRGSLAVGTRVRYRVLASDNRACAWGAKTESRDA